MESITLDKILKQLSDFDNEFILKPRKEVPLLLGADSEMIESITGKTIFIISGHCLKGLPPFVRFSPLIEKNTFIMMDDPNTF